MQIGNFHQFDYEMIDGWQNIFINQSGGSNQYFEIVDSNQSHNEKFNCDQYKFEIRFKTIQDSFEAHNDQISELFSQLYDFSKTKAKNKDYIGFIFDHPDLHWPMDHPLEKLETFDIRNLIRMFESVCQSKRNLRIDENLRVSLIVAKVPVGRGLTNSYLKSSNCLKIVQNFDNMCAIRAILIAKAYAEDSIYKADLCKLNSIKLEKLTIKMAKALNLVNIPCSLKEIAKIEQYLREFRITVFTKDNCIYKGVPNEKFLYLLYHDNHYSAIVSIKAFFNCSYYCNNCLVGYEQIGKHKCDNICNMCFNAKCLKAETIICEYCKKEAKSKKCYQNHCEKFCEKLKQCEVCGRFRTKYHVCLDEKFCNNCKIAVKLDHRCFVLTEFEKKQKKDRLAGYIFFDYEAMQENGNHEPNLICALKLCIECVNKRACKKKNCGRIEFKNNNSFCDWLFDQTSFTAIAHNMKGYDGVFIMNYIITNITPKDPKPTVITNGSKLLSISFKKVRIIDSISFIPISLSSFSGAFGIEELKKGFFPHLFNTHENQFYEGPYPDRKYYGVKFFTNNHLEEFNKWYSRVCHEKFNFQKEIKSYCWSDVELLAEGCIKFRKIIMDLTSKEGQQPIDPFENCMTIASLCHLIYRTNHLEPKTLAFIPETGYNTAKNHSYKAIQWLELLNREIKDIQHARNSDSEKRFGSYYVDGYSPSQNTIFEFHGCYFHGCPKCFSAETFNSVVQQTMKSLYTRHCNRISYLKSISNIKLIEIWECEFDQMDKNDLKLEQYARPPLVPRNALFGGRTNALKLHYKVQSGEKIHYVDFTSLYPYVQKYCRYPVGHPKIITCNFEDPMKYFGLIKCRILPPRKLYIPILPCKINNKLVFSLCQTCAEVNSSDSCTHSNDQRALEGTWVSVEVHKAIQLGYTILEIFEVWHWPESEKYDETIKSGGLFTKYINLFLKGKQESSGFPAAALNDYEKDKYIIDFEEKEGIQLDKNSIVKNAAQRFVFKLFLNSMWGRLGMNTNRTSYKIITNPADWFLLLQDKNYIIHRVDFTHTNVIQVYYSHLLNEGSTQTSVVHAAFVTSYARLKLYSELEQLGDRVLYFDTDSVIYVAREGQYIPERGNNLGELTYELDDEDDYIDEFVSAGPKNYAYTTFKGKSSCTVKGFRIDAEIKKIINFESIRNIVLKNREKKLKADQLLFKRDSIDWTVKCEIIEKLYSFVYDKRVLLDNLSTLPFGY